MFEIKVADGNGETVARYTEKDSFKAQDLRGKIRSELPAGSSHQVTVNKK